MSGLETAGLGVAVVARDDDTIVVDKPAGLPAEMREDRDGRSLLGRVRRAGWPHARLPHRLDAGTDGLQVVARDAAAVERHNAALRADAWAKRYVAVVEAGDDPSSLVGTHRRHLRREGRVATVVRSGGKPAWQDHEVVVPTAVPGVRAPCWAVVVRLRTGRYHQVRAVLADLGHPIVDDDRYGSAAARRADDRYPLLTHARLDGVVVDGAATSLHVEAVDPARRSWPEAVVAHLRRDDLA